LQLKVKNLRTEYKYNPIGIDVIVPRLSWELETSHRSCYQVAYQIKCAGTPDDLEDDKKLLWNSQQVETDKSIHVFYKGNVLKAGQRVYWKIRAWNSKGEVSEWSKPAFWQMGLLSNLAWKAHWIEPDIQEETSVSTPCPFLRKRFSIDKKIKNAIVYLTSRGLYELYFNGEKIGDEVFAPGWTSYGHRLQYRAYDVTKEINQGRNAIGVILADGWYRGYLVWQGNKNLYGDKLALLFQLTIHYEDGSKEKILSDGTWKSKTGPLLKSDIYNGEIYDARLEIPDWDMPDFDDSDWSGIKIRDYGYENIVHSEGVPVRITQTISPVEKIITPKGELVFDFGQNMVGWVRIGLKGNSGDTLIINHAEVLDQEGNFYLENIREAKAEDIYIFKGNGIETWEPRFTFHGFRYIKLIGLKGDISLSDISGRVVHSDMPETGNFECSDDLVNRLQKNIQWGLRGNFLDVPTDCPQRDERLGWTGDAQVFASTACFNRDVSSFYRKWMKDFIVDQKADGSVPWVVPNVVKDGGGTGWSDGFGATGWADAAVIIPWTVYQVYGDVRILSEQYSSMKAWEDYMIRESGDGCIFSSGFHFGDWLSFAEYYTYNYNAPDYGYAGAHTEKELIATAYFYYTTSLMRKIAGILGKNADAVQYSELLPRIREAFFNEFMTRTGRLTSNTQTAYVLALSFGLLPENMVEVAAKRLADDIRYFGHLTTGFLGTPMLCQALSDHGYDNLAYKLLFNKRYPSWLYPVTMGATTIWERWDGIKPDGSFQTVGMNSFNHYAYGAVGDWLYRYVAGLSKDPDIPGYKKIVIKPCITPDLRYAKASYHSVYGMIASHWTLQDGVCNLQVSVPPNTSASIYIPNVSPKKITEGDIRIDEIPDVVFSGIENSFSVLKVGSGTYSFTFPFKSVQS
jgi:alpha-L-rhamnosidase